MIHWSAFVKNKSPRVAGDSNKSVWSRFSDVANAVIKYRYLLALLVFAVLVIFKINGSNLGSWERILGTTGKSSVVAGTSRDIRSDEWGMLFPAYFSQQNSQTPFSLNNPAITLHGQNVLIVTDAPVLDIYSISKPLQWGFFFLHADYAISWYWDMKLLLILMLSFELCMILTSRDKLISVLGAFWIAFSPAVQWWFAQHVGNSVLYIEAIVVTFYYFLKYHDKPPLQILFAFLFSLSCLGFIIPLYPPVQIPFGILALILMLLIFTDFHKTISIRRRDIVIVGAAAVFMLLMAAHLYLIIKDVIPVMSNSIYPGRRVSTGGGTPNFDFYAFLTNIWLPYMNVSIPNENACELASFFNFLPAVLAALPILFLKRKNRTLSLKFGIALAVFSVFFALYMAFSFVSPIIAKITLLSYVTGSRAMLAYGYSAMLLSIWALSTLVRTGGVRRVYAIVIALAVSATYLCTVLFTGMKANVHLRYYLLLIAVLGILNYLLLKGKKRAFSLLMLGVIVAAGVSVNPVNIGAGVLLKSTLSKEIHSIAESDRNAVWMSDVPGDQTDVLIYANGARSAGGVADYPNFAQWSALDPQRKYASVYNRSAHIYFQIVKVETSFVLDWLGGFHVNINRDDLEKLKIKYLVSNRTLTEFNSRKVHFKQICAPDIANYAIYQVTYTN
jgi:hypothetical protein